MRRHLLTAGIVAIAAAGWTAAGYAAAFTLAIVAELDRAGQITAIAPRAQSTLVYDRAGRPAFAFYVEDRIDVPLAEVSPHMIDALLAVEDRRFFSHYGVDPIRIAGAAWRNLRAGR